MPYYKAEIEEIPITENVKSESDVKEKVKLLKATGQFIGWGVAHRKGGATTYYIVSKSSGPMRWKINDKLEHFVNVWVDTILDIILDIYDVNTVI